MKTPEAILFDLDDTLVSFSGTSNEIWRQCSERLIRSAGLPFPPEHFIQTLFRVKDEYWGEPERHKRGREDLKAARREVVAMTFDELGLQDKELEHRLADEYTSLQDASIHLYPGTLTTLEHLRNKRILLGLVTNGSSAAQRGKLDRFGLTGFFNVILIDQEVGFSKPDPRIFMLALDKLNLPSCSVWMVGDNLLWDIQGARNAGIYAVWANYCNAKTSENPDATIASIEELMTLV